MAWILVAFTLVFVMAPGYAPFAVARAERSRALTLWSAHSLGLLYSGLLRRKNALQMLFLSLMVFSVVYVEWFLWYVLGLSLSARAPLVTLHACPTRRIALVTQRRPSRCACPADPRPRPSQGLLACFRRGQLVHR